MEGYELPSGGTLASTREGEWMVCAGSSPQEGAGGASQQSLTGSRLPSTGAHKSLQRAAGGSPPLPSVGLCESLQRAVGSWPGLAGLHPPAPLGGCLQVPVGGSGELTRLGWLRPPAPSPEACQYQPLVPLHRHLRVPTKETRDPAMFGPTTLHRSLGVVHRGHQGLDAPAPRKIL